MSEETQNKPENLEDETVNTPPAGKSFFFAFSFWVVYVIIVFLVLEIFFKVPF
jgi:hypothetical protein